MSTESPITESKRKKKWYKRLRDKYVLIIRDDETLEPKLSFRLSRLNVFVVSSLSALLLIVFTIYLIAFTSLKEYIPGFADVNLSKNVYELHLRADSLEQVSQENQRFIENIKRIIAGDPPVDFNTPVNDTTVREYSQIKITRSKADSVLRKEMESQARFAVAGSSIGGQPASRESYNFFTPLKGIITNEFDASQSHYGIDIVAPQNEAVKATLDGMVIFASWTIETGHVIALQHQRNYISIYKHNSVLLKREGVFVRAGEPIAIVGQSGILTTGPHLHFELWFNGSPVNPRNYMAF